jgi:hypothetical protein
MKYSNKTQSDARDGARYEGAQQCEFRDREKTVDHFEGRTFQGRRLEVNDAVAGYRQFWG